VLECLSDHRVAPRRWYERLSDNCGEAALAVDQGMALKRDCRSQAQSPTQDVYACACACVCVCVRVRVRVRVRACVLRRGERRMEVCAGLLTDA